MLSLGDQLSGLQGASHGAMPSSRAVGALCFASAGHHRGSGMNCVGVWWAKNAVLVKRRIAYGIPMGLLTPACHGGGYLGHVWLA